MALPNDVSKAVVRLDYTALPITEENNLAAWQTIRAELHRLSEIAAAVDPLVVRLGEVTTKLEAADSLLRDIKDWDVNQAQGTYLMVPLNLRKRIQAHLSENTHDRA
jgi:hypothetical protein